MPLKFLKRYNNLVIWQFREGTERTKVIPSP